MWVQIALAALLLVGLPSTTSSQSLTELERQRLLAHLEMTSRWLSDELAGLSPTDLAFKPSAEAWSIGEVLDHLIVVAPIYWNDLQNALKTAAAADSAFTDADILWYGIDRTRREQAVPSEVPKGTRRNLSEALREYRAHHARLVGYVRTTKDQLRNHFVPRQGSDAYQWILLISTHEQRHILQIREIKATLRAAKLKSPKPAVQNPEFDPCHPPC